MVKRYIPYTLPRVALETWICDLDMDLSMALGDWTIRLVRQGAPTTVSQGAARHPGRTQITAQTFSCALLQSVSRSAKLLAS